MTEQRFVLPRRFSEVFQASEDWPGTLAQQLAVREAFKVEFGSNQHQLLKKIDRTINLGERHSLPVAFVALATVPQVVLGRGFATGMLLSDQLVPSAIAGIARHEFGHMYEQFSVGGVDLWTQADKNWFMAAISNQPTGDWSQYTEMFADAMKDWWAGTSWSSMTPHLLRG